jgi:hypothetical protein
MKMNYSKTYLQYDSKEHENCSHLTQERVCVYCTYISDVFMTQITSQTFMHATTYTHNY